MEATAGLLGLFGFFVMLILIIYPYVALGRIWFYSKQQVEILKQIQASPKQST